MKKKVKALIIAASIAAIAGIGAVSFAAWTATDSQTVTDNSLGHVNVAGLNATIAKVEDLLPYDQTTTYADQIQSVELNIEGATGAYNVQVTVKNWSVALETGSKLYVQITNSSTKPTIDTEHPITGWKDTSSAVLTTDNFEKTVSKVYVHFALDSNNNADMDKTFTVEYKLVPVAESSD